eukprot:scaffold103108_cov31-Tisochrysis_lutea.AAC.1
MSEPLWAGPLAPRPRSFALHFPARCPPIARLRVPPRSHPFAWAPRPTARPPAAPSVHPPSSSRPPLPAWVPATLWSPAALWRPTPRPLSPAALRARRAAPPRLNRQRLFPPPCAPPTALSPPSPALPPAAWREHWPAPAQRKGARQTHDRGRPPRAPAVERAPLAASAVARRSRWKQRGPRREKRATRRPSRGSLAEGDGIS